MHGNRFAHHYIRLRSDMSIAYHIYEECSGTWPSTQNLQSIAKKKNKNNRILFSTRDEMRGRAPKITRRYCRLHHVRSTHTR